MQAGVTVTGRRVSEGEIRASTMKQVTNARERLE